MKREKIPERFYPVEEWPDYDQVIHEIVRAFIASPSTPLWVQALDIDKLIEDLSKCHYPIEVSRMNIVSKGNYILYFKQPIHDQKTNT